jgi:hypothetical protein
LSRFGLPKKNEKPNRVAIPHPLGYPSVEGGQAMTTMSGLEQALKSANALLSLIEEICDRVINRPDQAKE